MKTEGGVVVVTYFIDRTEIEGEIDESLSAKWSTWNTLSFCRGKHKGKETTRRETR